MTHTKRQKIPTIAEPTNETVEVLLAIFKAAIQLEYAQVALWEKHTPGALWCLRLWASGLGLDIKAVGEHCISVELPKYRGCIMVHTDE